MTHSLLLIPIHIWCMYTYMGTLYLYIITIDLLHMWCVQFLNVHDFMNRVANHHMLHVVQSNLFITILIKMELSCIIQEPQNEPQLCITSLQLSARGIFTCSAKFTTTYDNYI